MYSMRQTVIITASLYEALCLDQLLYRNGLCHGYLSPMNVAMSSEVTRYNRGALGAMNYDSPYNDDA